MKYNFTKTAQHTLEVTPVKNTEYPLHEMGEDFFVMSSIENGEEHYFNGIHRHDFYEFLWFTEVKPKQFHYIDFIRYPISPNALFLLLPDQVHCIEKKDKAGYLFAMSRDFFERLIGGDIFKLFYQTVNFRISIPDAELCLFQKMLELIQREYEGEKRAAILESYLRSWFLHCIELQKLSQADQKPDLRLYALMDSVELYFREQRSAAFYAHELALSAKRLNELTREAFGKTITQLINDRLILEAKREISSCDKSIKEISYELGFSEPSYFTRFFGKQTGYSPEDFRKRMRFIYDGPA
jgi:AraC family transcriptional activator of pobA